MTFPFPMMGINSAAFITATGGTITTSGNYKVHTFTSSGTFQITSGSGDVEYLVVAGGGGGGGDSGGGGGAGMMLTGTKTSMTAGSYTVTVGAGGTGGSNTNMTAGSDSVFDNITSKGGGRGGRSTAAQGGTGYGSGGGGGYLAETA